MLEMAKWIFMTFMDIHDILFHTVGGEIRVYLKIVGGRVFIIPRICCNSTFFFLN